MIFPENFENKIDFTRIRVLIKEECLSELGRTLVDDMVFMNHRKAISNRLQETYEFKQIIQKQESFPVEHYYDLRPTLNKVRVIGTFFEVKELHNLRRSLTTVKAIVRFFKKEEAEEDYPKLTAISANVVIHPYVTDGIDRILTSQGKIKDNASPELANIRSELAAKQREANKLIHRIIANAQKEGWVDEGTSLAIRDGRAVIPVQASNKRKISGIIHDESATGKTCYVEPSPVVEINNVLSELENEERREIVRILKEFTETVRPYIDDLEDSIVFLGIIDFIRSKAKFGIKTNSSLPKLSEHQAMNWTEACHPLLYLSFLEEERQVVPLQLQLDVDNRILLISGPNAGGKSVCLKTVGLLQYMLQCGMLIPVGDESETAIFENVFIDIGDEQSIENDLSTYSSHLLNMKHFSRNANDKTLVLIDEFGTGTEPMLGGAIAEAVLQKLNDSKAYGVITTHYTNLKHYASQEEGIVNGAMLYDTQKLEPLFKLEMGKPGSSFAFEIAHKIGLPQDVIDNAKEKIGEDHVHFDKHLKDVLKDKRYWERKRQNIRKVERRLEEYMEKEKIELEKAKDLRKEIIDKAEKEAEKLLADSNKVIENTVRKIKEANANKERTKEVRKELDDFKEKVANKDSVEEDKIMRKMEKLRKREIQVAKTDKPEKTDVIEKPKVERKREFTIGMPVKIKGQSSIGELMELNDKNAIVAFGNLLTSVSASKLEHLEKDEKQSIQKKSGTSNFRQTMELNQRRIRFKPGLDVRGDRGEAAVQKVTDFIDEAIVLGVLEVKILHGKGNGILRQLIREYLFTVDIVQKVQDEHIEFGGAGITVVTLG